MSKIKGILNLSYCRYYSTRMKNKKVPIISCKRPELNHYEGQNYDKADMIPLVSKDWLGYKSRNDYFIIHGDPSKKIKQPVYGKSFEEIGVTPNLVQVMLEQGFSLPTEIQTKAIPAILNGHSTIIAAETGSGKTLAYLLPIFQQILLWKSRISIFNSPMAVVVTPNRELAIQLGEVAQSIARRVDLQVTTLLGGRTKLKMYPPKVHYDLLVVYLGAYKKGVNTEFFNTDNVHHIVLDEADTLLGAKFFNMLSHFMKKFAIQHKVQIQKPPQGCQLTLASATMPVELLEADCFGDPMSMKIISSSNLHRLLPNVSHKFIRLLSIQKQSELLKLVQADVNEDRSVVIFTNEASTCDFISMFLKENNIECMNMNGKDFVTLMFNKYEEFKSGNVKVVSCTDIAFKGLDSTRIQHVINYDFPMSISDYIHRSGRTGRIGSPADCRVTNFIAWRREIKLVQKIEMSIRENNELPSVNTDVSKIIDEIIGITSGV